MALAETFVIFSFLFSFLHVNFHTFQMAEEEKKYSCYAHLFFVASPFKWLVHYQRSLASLGRVLNVSPCKWFQEVNKN